MGSCAAPSAKGDDKFITTDYLQQCPINYLVLLDQLEWQRSDNTNNFSWSVNSWIGGDTDRIWLKSEGERSNGETEAAEAQLLWGALLQIVGGDKLIIPFC